MMSDSARSIVLVFDECHTRIQTVSELLLISCTPRPVFTRPEDLAQTKESFVRYRDKVIGQLNRMLILSRDIATQVHAKQIHWKPFCHRTQELTTTVIHLSELAAHIAYLMAINITGSQPAGLGLVTNMHQLTQADLDVRFSCTKLKRSRMNDLQPHLLVDLCSTLTKALTTMTDICRNAAEKTPDTNDQDQFKLCVKAITSTTGCLVSSIKSFKQMPSETHLRRVVTFCDPVTSASAALLNFATEEGFLGEPAQLSYDGLETYKSVLGLCMSIASANIQICRAVRDLVYSSSTKRHQDRMSLCVESVTRSSSQLRDLLLFYEFMTRSESLVPDYPHCSANSKSQEISSLDPESPKEHHLTEVQIDNNKDDSKSLHITEEEEEEDEGCVSPRTPRSSVEKEILMGQEGKKSVLLGSPDSLRPHEPGHRDHQRGMGDKELSSPSLSVSPSSSRPTSFAADAEIVLHMGMDESPLRSSPQHFLSSPLSVSSSSLASISSLNVAPELLALAESRESMLALEGIDSSGNKTCEDGDKESLNL